VWGHVAKRTWGWFTHPSIAGRPSSTIRYVLATSTSDSRSRFSDSFRVAGDPAVPSSDRTTFNAKVLDATVSASTSAVLEPGEVHMVGSISLTCIRRMFG
jgi:hypothetical protein